MYIDWTYILLVLPAVALSLWASAKVKLCYKRYSGISNSQGITGAQAARRVLNDNGLYGVQIMTTAGELTDHYDPADNVIRLSEGVYGSDSIAAIGVACHEAGHAVQHAQDYAPARIRTAIVPVTNIGAKLSTPLIIVGLLLASLSNIFIYLAYAGVALFSLSAIFQLVTLPTEFDASRRAMAAISSSGQFSDGEVKGAKKMLSAAALTYVAALAVAIMQLLRFIIMVSGSDRRRR